MDSTMEIFALKDAFWKLTARVAVIENIISEKFGSTAFSAVHKQLSMGNCSTNTVGQSLGQSQITSQNPEVGDNKTKLKSVTISPAASKRKSTAASSTQSTPAVEKRRRVSRLVNYNEDDEEDSAGEETSKADPELLDELDSTVPTIKIEDDDGDEDYDPNEDDGFPDLSPASNNNEDESSKPPQQSGSGKDNKYTPKPKSKRDSQNKEKDSVGDAEKKSATSFTDDENMTFRLTKSAWGKDILIDGDNYTYNQHRTSKSGMITWKCTKYRNLKCKGLAKTINGLLQTCQSHNHVENPLEPKLRELRTAITTAAKTSSDSTSKIIAQALENEPSIVVKDRLPKIKSIQSQVRRLRRPAGNEQPDQKDLTHFMIPPLPNLIITCNSGDGDKN